ncbi:hypothetical protein LCGC14_0353580 [marine sediment metagenome]|uniref:Uncharacterized protein n=1 Tax=marine sediment metagenome TaxID=412755 RepID=A0A0F9VXE2_9ZZZZ
MEEQRGSSIKPYGTIEIELRPKIEDMSEKEADRLFWVYLDIEGQVKSFMDTLVEGTDDFTFSVKE